MFSELRNIVLKTVGLAEPVRDALKLLSSAIRAAFVYGSMAKATDQTASDIDLMIISDSLTVTRELDIRRGFVSHCPPVDRFDDGQSHVNAGHDTS